MTMSTENDTAMLGEGSPRAWCCNLPSLLKDRGDIGPAVRVA
jgi:hypothetical protein